MWKGPAHYGQTAPEVFLGLYSSRSASVPASGFLLETPALKSAPNTVSCNMEDTASSPSFYCPVFTTAAEAKLQSTWFVSLFPVLFRSVWVRFSIVSQTSWSQPALALPGLRTTASEGWGGTPFGTDFSYFYSKWLPAADQTWRLLYPPTVLPYKRLVDLERSQRVTMFTRAAPHCPQSQMRCGPLGV